MTLHIKTGRPEPQPEAELVMRAALRDLDPLLDVRWFPASVYCRQTESLEGRYAVICTWPQTDRRWSAYHAGEIGEPHDILGWLTDASGRLADWFEPGDAAAADLAALTPRVLEMLGKCDNTRQPWAKRMASVVGGNAARREAVRALAAEEMHDHLAYHGKRMAGEPIVNLGTGESEAFDPRMRRRGERHRYDADM